MANDAPAGARNTHGRLVAAARRLFERHGYAETPLDAVAASCGLTKGALYHHFASKEELFEAVVLEAHRELAALSALAYDASADPQAAAEAAAHEFLEQALDSGVRRLLFVDGPVVLGPGRARELEASCCLELIKHAIRDAQSAGHIPGRDVDSLAHLLFGALAEGAMFVAHNGDPQRAKELIEDDFRGLLAALAA